MKRKLMMKVYRKYQQREQERHQTPTDFPDKYFFSALAEVLLDE